MFPSILISFFSSIQALVNKMDPFPSETEALMTLISGNNIPIGVTSLRMLEAGLHKEDLPGSNGCEPLVLRTSVPKSVLFCCYFFLNRGKSIKSLITCIWEYVCVKSLQLCPTLCDPMDCSLPGSSVHGILQARILKWAAIPFSRAFPDPGIEPGSPALQTDSLSSEPPEPG